MGIWENYFGSVSQQNNNPSFRIITSKSKKIEYHCKENCGKFGLPVLNKNIAVNVLLPLFDFFCHNRSVFSKIILL